MSGLYPLTFEPILQERIWGGRNLARLYGRTLPGDAPIGESWEISDREEALSVIRNGPLAGRSLRWLLETQLHDVLGTAAAPGGRFPLLVKIIDAQMPLSLQVHPSEDAAAELGGTAKMEMWYVAEAREGAEVLAGLRRGTSRAALEAGVKSGTVLDCIHRIPVQTGDAMLVPGGRVHAVGGNVVLFEVQQNSDTTYRLFDWNRVDAIGRPRRLHVDNALRCIDFTDYEPRLLAPPSAAADHARLADTRAFRVGVETLAGEREVSTEGSFLILGGITGSFVVESARRRLVGSAGTFCLIPACLAAARVASDRARLLLIRSGS